MGRPPAVLVDDARHFRKARRRGAQGIHRRSFQDDARCELRRHCSQRARFAKPVARISRNPRSSTRIRAFLLGDSFSLADAACFHPVWFLRAEPTAFGLAQKFPHLMRWFDRIDAMGYGDVRPMDPDEALKIAKDSTPATAENVDSSDPNGLEAGTRVSVTPDDYGFDPVTGRVVVSTIHEIAIEREVPELGKIVNHFPKIGFRIAAA